MKLGRISIPTFLKIRFSKNKAFLKKISNLLGFLPGNIDLYQQAFRHNSIAQDQSLEHGKTSNERLEFLGDAILDCVIAEFLFLKYPTKGEGFLTELRSKIVSRERLADLASKMGLDQFLQYDKSLRNNGPVIRSISGNALEALIGAIYLDKGYPFTRRFIIQRILTVHLDVNALASAEFNFKSKLIEWAQKNKKAVAFEVLHEKIRGRQKTYVMQVLVDGEAFGEAEDFSKKKAEQAAAEKACKTLLGKELS